MIANNGNGRKWIGAWLLPACLLMLSSCSSNQSSEGLGVYPKAVGASDEAFAIQAVRTIATAELQFQAARGSFGDFQALTQAGFLDVRFAAATPTLKGYLFNIQATETRFAVNADPKPTENQPTTGVRHFYLDSSGDVIHVNSTGPASKTDPAL